jgi:hypothetical protein
MLLQCYILWGISLILVSICLKWHRKYVLPVKQGQQRQTEFEEQTKLIQDIREAITSHILNDNVEIFNAIAKQKIILNTNKRGAIAIFLSTDQLKVILTKILINPDNIENLVTTLSDLNVPIAFIGNLPVYVSALLTDAPVFVVGGIKWDIN